MIMILCLAAGLISCGRISPLQVAQPDIGPVFQDGQAQKVPAFSDHNDWIVHDLWVETEFDTDGDGRPDRMHVSVTRPHQTDSFPLKLPVIYITSPYFAGVASADKRYFWDVRQELGEKPPPRVHPPPIKYNEKSLRPSISTSHTRTWVPRGYIVVHSSSPGTGLSDGSPTVGGINETLAPKAVIDWLCGRGKGYTTRKGQKEIKAYWSSGKVGMTGTSYNGTLPIAAATTGVEGLEAIIPIAPNTSYYHYYRANGLIRHPGGYLGEDIDVLYDFIHSGEPSSRPYADSLIRDIEMARGMDRITGDYNDFWEERDYIHQLGSMRAALLMSHGFNDWNVMPEHSLGIYEAAKAIGIPAQIYYHQAGHGGPPPMKMMNRWFTRYLHGVQNGVEKEARAWIVRENDNTSNPTPYADYPNPAASSIQLHLSGDGIKHGTLMLEKIQNRIKETIIDNVGYTGAQLAQQKQSNHRLLYLSPYLKDSLHLSGRSKITIRASSDKPAVNLSVWLISLPWNRGNTTTTNDNLITRGWADLQNHHSLSESEPLIPGQFYDMTFELEPDDQIIPRGQRIGLMIFSSDREFTLWPEPGTKLTVDLNETILNLPVVGGSKAWESAMGESIH